jgi:hypothetical protein
MTDPQAGTGVPATSAGAPGPVDAADHSPASSSRRLEVAGAVVALGISLLLFFLADRIELRVETGGIDPRWWPRTLGMIGIAVSVLLLLVSALRTPPDRDEVEAATPAGRIRLAATVALAFAYMFVWPAVGFVPATLVLLVVATAVFGGRGVRALVLFPVCLTAALYLLFDVALEVPL